MKVASLMTIIIVVVLLLPGSALSQNQRKSRRARDICNEALSRGDMDRCDHRIFQEAEKKLTEVYERLRARLDEGKRSQLENAQRAWVGFRDANCGLASDFVYRQCMTRMARERASELRNYNSSFMERR